VIGWGASVAGAGWYGIGLGEDRIIAKQASDDKIRQETREAAQQGAADAIAKLKPVNTTIVQKTQREIRENTVYAECRVPAGGSLLPAPGWKMCGSWPRSPRRWSQSMTAQSPSPGRGPLLRASQRSSHGTSRDRPSSRCNGWLTLTKTIG